MKVQVCFQNQKFIQLQELQHSSEYHLFSHLEERGEYVITYVALHYLFLCRLENFYSGLVIVISCSNNPQGPFSSGGKAEERTLILERMGIIVTPGKNSCIKLMLMKNFTGKFSVQRFNITKNNTEKKPSSLISNFQNDTWFIPGKRELTNYNFKSMLWEIALDEPSILFNKFPYLLAHSVKLFPGPEH